MKILSSVSFHTGTRSCHITGTTSVDLDQCFIWAAVLSYNAQFHVINAAMQGFPFTAFDQQLYMTILDATAAQRYLPVDVSDVTLPQPWCHWLSLSPGGPAGEGFSMWRRLLKASRAGEPIQRHQQQHSFPQGSGPHLPPVLHQGREICIKYQSNSCTFPNCRWAHILQAL